MILNPAASTSGTPPTPPAAATQGGTTPSCDTATRFPSKRQYHASQQSPAWSGTDWCAPENAHVLANRIKAYWAKRGKTVNIELIAAKASKGSNLHHFAIRSDMVGGRPRPSHLMVRP